MCRPNLRSSALYTTPIPPPAILQMMSMRETIFNGVFCGFLICNSLRFCEESRKHCSSTEPSMWHRTCQAQQRKANAVAIATKRRLQEALAERRVDLISHSLTACGFRECSALIALSTSTQRVQAVLSLAHPRLGFPFA